MWSSRSQPYRMNTCLEAPWQSLPKKIRGARSAEHSMCCASAGAAQRRSPWAVHTISSRERYCAHEEHSGCATKWKPKGSPSSPKLPPSSSSGGTADSRYGQRYLGDGLECLETCRRVTPLVRRQGQDAPPPPESLVRSHPPS